ncbi:MAG: histidinol-phosphatase [Bacteroidia bacterium]|nr:histidinol-phosphatase [Bacteroidia bacterium]MDW8159546.1 histidinol-phosphatase [Bacteroidia bacterium]
MKTKILFLDRDGTLIEEPEDFKVDSIEKVKFIPGAISTLQKIVQQTNFRLVIVTNQEGLGTAEFPWEKFQEAQQHMLNILAQYQIYFDEVLIDRSYEYENLPTRKPGTALVQHYFTQQYDLPNSFMIGDRYTDMQFAQNVGCQGILLLNPRLAPQPQFANYAVKNWFEIEELFYKLKIF